MRKLHLMSIREAAQTGILSEYALRMMIKRGELPAIFVGRKALINYEALCNMIAAVLVWSMSCGCTRVCHIL